MRALLVAAGLAFASGFAHADTLSFTSVVPPTGYDAYGGFGLQVLTPGFDAGLGTLDRVSMTVVGSVQDSLFSFSGNTLPFAAVFNNVGSINGDGFSESEVLSQTTGTASTLLANSSFAVDAIVATDQDLKDYASAAVIGTDYMFYSTVTNAGTGQLVAYDSDYALFSGTVTETFTYTAIPEPGSAGILVLGLLAITGLAARGAARPRWQRRNPR